MRIVAAEWLPYRLPLRRPWASAAGGLDERRGRLLRLATDDGRSGWGDCAPFPEIGIDPEAAAAHAEECALLDLAAQAAGLPLAAWLTGGQAVPDIAVNAALGSLQALARDAVDAACAAGFRVLKIKVGLGDPAAELARLREIAAALPPGVTLRLDANRAWPEETAAAFLGACTALPVEGVEEPLAWPDLAALRRLQAAVPFPLALDESISLAGDDFFARPPVRRLILKPARHGGPLAALDLALAARSAGIECIVTSSLESACGLAAAAHLAAAVAPRAVHGLATAHWFAADTGPAPAIANGRLILPDAPGIGFSCRIS
ncbi:MAG TPA: o-succinylbenzoate synthase [Rhodocyclaceae bacterium]|nr:o-succinylbenzoate synthase [Rhodocyclaceae bacterium]